MRVEQTTREKRIHRDGMDKYVFEPSRDYGAAFGAIGLGVGLCIVAVFASTMSKPFAASLIIISMASLFGGVGWAIMIKARLDAYYFDIMQERAIEETRISEHDEPQTTPRRITNGKGEVIVELETGSDIKPDEWRKIAYSVLVLRTSIAKAPLSKNKNTKVISQPCYDRFYAYMNEQGYMSQKDNTNYLTDDGKKFLANYHPTPQTHSTILANGS